MLGTRETPNSLSSSQSGEAGASKKGAQSKFSYKRGRKPSDFKTYQAEKKQRLTVLEAAIKDPGTDKK